MLPFPPSVPDLTVRDDDGMEPAGPMGDAEVEGMSTVYIAHGLFLKCKIMACSKFEI